MFHVGPDLGPNCLQKNISGNIIRVTNSLDPNQDGCSMSVLIWVQTVCKKLYQEHYQSIKQLRSRPGPMLHVGPDLGPNCLQRLSADDKSPLHLARKEL